MNEGTPLGVKSTISRCGCSAVNGPHSGTLPYSYDVPSYLSDSWLPKYLSLHAGEVDQKQRLCHLSRVNVNYTAFSKTEIIRDLENTVKFSIWFI
jgi:hypothetical protein